jgi:putative transposase
MNFIDAHDFSVDLVLRVLHIPASTYYDWRKARRERSRRAGEDAELLRLIDAIRGEHEFAATYGSPRVWLELRNRGVKVGRNRVARIMRANERKGAYLRRTGSTARPGRSRSTRRRGTCWAVTSPPSGLTRSGSRI